MLALGFDVSASRVASARSPHLRRSANLSVVVVLQVGLAKVLDLEHKPLGRGVGGRRDATSVVVGHGDVGRRSVRTSVVAHDLLVELHHRGASGGDGAAQLPAALDHFAPGGFGVAGVDLGRLVEWQQLPSLEHERLTALGQLLGFSDAGREPVDGQWIASVPHCLKTLTARLPVTELRTTQVVHYSGKQSLTQHSCQRICCWYSRLYCSIETYTMEISQSEPVCMGNTFAPCAILLVSSLLFNYGLRETFNA